MFKNNSVNVVQCDLKNTVRFLDTFTSPDEKKMKIFEAGECHWVWKFPSTNEILVPNGIDRIHELFDTILESGEIERYPISSKRTNISEPKIF